MQVTFLEAKLALAKQFGVFDETTGGTVDKAYPKAKQFKTHTVEFGDGDIRAYHKALQAAASQWHCLLKGTPKHQLTEFASRSKLTDRNDKTQLLVLDIDGLDWPVVKGSCNAEQLTIYAQDFINILPECFQNTSTVAVASSSMAYKSGLRMHLHFLLETPMLPEALRLLVTWLNLNTDGIKDALKLTPAKAQVSMAVDPCVCDNSRLIYIAPPIFENGSNPFKHDSDRIVLIRRASDTLDLTEVMQDIDREKVARQKERLLTQLLSIEGLTRTKPRTTTVNHRGQQVRVLKNPDAMEFELAYYNDEFVYYNINGGDSNAYWVWMDNPEIVYSFKPDETPFSFKAANRQAYDDHIQKFGKQIRRAQAVEDEDGVKHIPLVIRDFETDQHFAVKYDPFDDRILRMAAIGKGNINDWLASYGQMEPDNIPQYDIFFDPNNQTCHDEQARRLNTYKVPDVIRKAPMFEGDPLSFGDADDWMAEHTPVCHQIMMNMLGDDPLVFEQFVNWLAFMIQRKEKPETAWVVHGVEGTGKGIFIKRIAKPLLGMEYVIEKKLQDIADDKFNGYMATALLLFIDEFNIKNASNVRAAADLLKQQITESSLTIREMQQNPVNRQTHFGMIFASNDVDQMRISPTDRRYNVAPYQENSLLSRITDLQTRRTEYDAKILAELPALAAMLSTFAIEEHRVRVPINNEAKRLSREAGMTQDELFFKAFMDGNLEFFDYIATSTFKAHEMADMQILKQHVVRWMADALTESESFIDKEVLRILFEKVTGITMSQVAWGRKCNQYKLVQLRTKKDGIRYRGYRAVWQHSDHEMLKSIVEAQPRNVTQMR